MAKWYVVNVESICIDSEYRDFGKANERALAMIDGKIVAPGAVRVMTKPRVGGQVLDPSDEASWKPKRNNPGMELGTMQWHVLVKSVEIESSWDTEEEALARRRELREQGIQANILQADQSSHAVTHNPAGVVKTERDRRLWTMAKRSADKQGRGEDWAYVMGIFERMKNREGGSVRENPGELLIVNPVEHDSAKAENIYEMWHQKNPKHAGVLKPGVDSDDDMVCVGRAHNIVYRSGKWQKGRKTEDYIHHFDSKPKVWMLRHLVEDGMDYSGDKTAGDLLKSLYNDDGRFAVAELAVPLSFCLDDGTTDGCEMKIHSGARVYGGVDKKTLVIVDPHWKLIVVKGGQMHFDERGIVK